MRPDARLAGPTGPVALELQETQAERVFRRLLIAGVVLGLLLMVAASAATGVLVKESDDATAWVNHTYLVERNLSDLRVNFEKTEAARRGYLITGADLYPGIYDAAAAREDALVAEIRGLTRDNPRQRVAVARLSGLLTAKIAEQRASMALVRREAGAGAQAGRLIRQDQGRVDAIRVTLAAMVAEEQRLLDLRTAKQNRDSETLLAVVIGSGGLLALLVVGSFLLMRRYAGDLDRSRQALRRLNAGLEDAVARRTAELTRANAEIQRFAYIVSHDLRSPLVNVMGFTSELEMATKPLARQLARVQAEAPALLDAEAKEAVERDLPESLGFIRTSTQKMDRLINAILKLSREGRRNLSPEPLKMAALMGQIADSLRRQTEDRGATVTVAEDLPDIVGDRLATEQVFSNVIENALKYLKTGRAGDIRIAGRAEGGRVIYDVADNGRGIAPGDHERVFELFRRAGAQDQPGEGIGLAHVRALVHRLGGTITVQSELDRGATFRIALPPVLSRPEETA